jgi:hypothetical protein
MQHLDAANSGGLYSNRNLRIKTMTNLPPAGTQVQAPAQAQATAPAPVVAAESFLARVVAYAKANPIPFGLGVIAAVVILIALFL